MPTLIMRCWSTYWYDVSCLLHYFVSLPQKKQQDMRKYLKEKEKTIPNSYSTFKKIARYLSSESTKIAAIKELGDAGENISIVVESSPTKWQAYSLAGGSKDVEMMDTDNARDDNDNNDNENTNEETVYAGLASSKPKRDTAIEGNNNTLKKSHATRLKKHEPITKLDQIGLTRTKKLEYAVLSSSAKFCDAIPYLDEITATNPNTPYHHLMTVSLTNVDFRNRSGGAPKQLSLYKKPKLTVVSTCKAAREVIFDALHGNVELDDLKLISSENENDASLADQVESLYTSQQLSRLRPKGKMKNTNEAMIESMEMHQTCQKRRRDSEEARDSEGEVLLDQLVQYSQGSGSPFQFSPSGISNKFPTANARSDSQSPILLSSDNSDPFQAAASSALD